MAARLNPRHSELVLKRIKTRQLVNRLQDNALGLLTKPKLVDGQITRDPVTLEVIMEPYEMSRSQVAAAQFLVERTLAKAEAPKDINVTGHITLERLIESAIVATESDAAESSRTSH